MKKLKTIPKFKNIKAESDFWQTHDSTDYIDWNRAEIASFPNLKLSAKSISLRLPEALLNDIKILANKQDIPYQSFIKMLLAQNINRFLGAR